MKKFSCFLIVICLIFITGCKKEENYVFPKNLEITNEQSFQNSKVKFDKNLWTTPKYIDLADDESLDENILKKPVNKNIKSILIDGVTIKGVKTKFFAFLGIPETASADKKCPAIVLVHGGQGTAFYDWVELWMKRGYVAIALDTESNAPTNETDMTRGFKIPLPTGIRGVSNSGWYSDEKEEIENQWMYQAVAEVIICNSLLRSLDVVNSSKIGITGISWGGVITTISIIYDNRFAFAVTVYGTINMTNTDGNFGKIYSTQKIASELWDNGEGLKTVKTPTLYINSNIDYHFSIDGNSKSYEDTKYSKLLFIDGLGHDQYTGAVIKEVETFASMVVKEKNLFVEIEKAPQTDDLTLKIDEFNLKKTKKIELYFTQNDKLNPSTKWLKKDINKNELKIQLEDGTKFFYLVVSSMENNKTSTKLVKI